MNNEILSKVDEIVSYIENSSTYKDYLLLKEKLSNNEEIKDIIDLIKSKQKELVKKEYNKEDVSLLNEELKSLEDKLNEYPLYVDYINKQDELNEVFGIIKEKIEKSIDMNLE